MAGIIEVKDVKKSFTFGKGGMVNQVLKGASFSVEKGDFVSLMGPSGSGKSTMLYLIGGLDREYEGSISILNQPIEGMKERELSQFRLDKIGFIFQFYNLIQNLSVEDNILLPLEVKGVKRSQVASELDEILEIVGLTAKRKSLPHQLSGGQQQRVAIARAVIGNPEIILADEATGNLDSVSGAEIMNLFKQLNAEKGITFLQVTHSDDCATYGNKVIRMANGVIVE